MFRTIWRMISKDWGIGIFDEIFVFLSHLNQKYNFLKMCVYKYVSVYIDEKKYIYSVRFYKKNVFFFSTRKTHY